MTIDAARRSSAAKITVILPYYGFQRQDKKGIDRASLGAAVIANILQSMGVNQIISIDLHADQIQLAYQIPFEHISGKHLFEDNINHIINECKLNDQKVLFVSPDAGGTTRVKNMAKYFGIDYVAIEKNREKPGQIKSMRLLADPAEIKDTVTIIVDDIVDTGGTLILADKTLKEAGVKENYIIITHAVLSNNAIEKLTEANIKLITSNTRCKLNNNKNPNFTVVDCGTIIMQAIINISENKSIIKTLA